MKIIAASHGIGVGGGQVQVSLVALLLLRLCYECPFRLREAS